MDEAVKLDFPISVVGLPVRESHFRLNALCSSSSGTLDLGRASVRPVDFAYFPAMRGMAGRRSRLCEEAVSGKTKP